MPTETIAEPAGDELMRFIYSHAMRKSKQLVVGAGQKFACVLLSLDSAVTKADYPALKTAVEAIPGIQQIDLLIDGRAPTSVPGGQEVLIAVHARVLLENVV